MRKTAFAAGLLMLAACKPDPAAVSTAVDRRVGSVDTAAVKVAVLAPQDFALTTVSNGKVRAERASDLYLPSTEPVTAVNVHNGSRVGAGQVIAVQRNARAENQLKAARAALRAAQLEMQDVIISQGYKPGADVPASVLDLARVRSGVERAEINVRAAELERDATVLRAPFAGVVANLTLSVGSTGRNGEAACRIIDPASLTVEFPLLESELAAVKPGMGVEVHPIGTENICKAQVLRFNPMVDKNGQITVQARVTSGREALLDGMNVKAVLRKNGGRQLVVPKTAVVKRQNRDVVFTASKGCAMWNYVSLGEENMDSYVVKDGLNEGDSIIVSGAEGLAHESPVKYQ